MADGGRVQVSVKGSQHQLGHTNARVGSGEGGVSGFLLYGAKEEVYRSAFEILQERLPGLQIVGRCNGYWPEDKMDELVEMINRSGAEILFLALGSPKQERWFAKHRDKLPGVRVCQGIGGTLDVIAGNVKRAPEIFCKLGLKLFYRLAAEPKRWRRQLVLPVFAWQVLMAKVRMILGR